MAPQPPHDRDPEPDLAPGLDRRVRRLLAEARADEPMPPAVASRMERALEQLAEEPGRPRLGSRAVPAPRAVTDLATRRRRAATWLVAAAAVVVVGVGIGQVVGQDGAMERSGAGSSTEAGGEADGEPGLADDDGAATLDEGVGESGARAPQSLSDSLAADGRELRLSEKGFPSEVAELQSEEYAVRDQAAPPAPAESDRDRTTLDERSRAVARACRTDSWGRGTFVAVRYRGAPAVLVFRDPRGETQVVDLHQCGTAAPVRSVTLPAP